VLRSDHDVTVACYASLLSRNRWQEYVGRIATCIVDEVHLNYTPSAMRMLMAFMEGGANILGMTATPQRAGGDPLTKFYGEPTFRYEYPSAAADGWLVPLKVWLTVLQDLVHDDLAWPDRSFVSD
jgi:superfamily II DNA or RNA helicase